MSKGKKVERKTLVELATIMADLKNCGEVSLGGKKVVVVNSEWKDWAVETLGKIIEEEL